MVRFRLVGLELEIGEDRAEKQPRAEFARHQIGVLALPAEPGAGGERLSISGAVSTNTFTSALSGRAAETRNPASSFSLPLSTSW